MPHQNSPISTLVVEQSATGNTQVNLSLEWCTGERVALTVALPTSIAGIEYLERAAAATACDMLIAHYQIDRP